MFYSISEPRYCIQNVRNVSKMTQYEENEKNLSYCDAQAPSYSHLAVCRAKC